MNRIGICGGANVDVTFDASLSYIGVDHGIETLMNQGITPIVGVGDFDSLQQKDILETMEIEVLPTRKDITDTEYAIIYALEKGYQEIILYGVTGGRIDHFMAVLCLLQKYHEARIIILDQQNKIKLLSAGKHRIPKSTFTYFSIFALSDSYITISSCEYPLHNYYLSKEDPLCVSNQVCGQYSEIVTTKEILLIQSKDC